MKNLTPPIQLFHFFTQKNRKKPAVSGDFSDFSSLHSRAARLYFRWMALPGGARRRCLGKDGLHMKQFPIALQLYSVRDAMGADFEGTL